MYVKAVNVDNTCVSNAVAGITPCDTHRYKEKLASYMVHNKIVANAKFKSFTTIAMH